MKALWSVFLLFLITALSCSKVDNDHIVNLNGGRIDVIGHGGSGFQSIINPFPTNSFLSIKNAVDGLNVDGVEVDIQFSSDSVLMLYHDNVLEESTNCIGCVNDKLSETVSKCIYNNDFGARALRNETIITVHTLVEYFRDRTKKPYIFLNTKFSDQCISSLSDYEDGFAKLISRVIKDNGAYDRISVYYGNADFLNKVRASDSLVNVVYDAKSFDDGLDACTKNNISTMVIDYDEVSAEQVTFAHSKNIKVILWGLRTRKEIVGAVKKNPDGILTENIPLVQAVLRD
jgi:glycerophosphoryl diester phosphodiesterase